METTPFLTADAFAAMIAPRVLSPAERALVELLVVAAAAWIRDPTRRPDLGVNDPLATQAKLITYMVINDALGPVAGADRRVTKYRTSADNRETEVTYAEAAKLLSFDESHLALLGLSLTAAPRATFDDFATAFTDVDVYGRRRW